MMLRADEADVRHGRKTASQRALIISALLHGGFFVLLLLGTLVEAFRRERDPHVFTLIAAPVPRVEDRVEGRDELSPSGRQPESEPVEPPPPVKRISYEDFAKMHGTPKTAHPSIPKVRKVEVEEIDIDRLKAKMAGIVSESEEETRAESASASLQLGLRLYIDRLRESINLAWTKPASLSGKRLEANVRFSVDGAGKIGSVELIDPSGNVIFDASVRAAFVDAVAIGPTPHGRSYTLRLMFRMID